MDPFSKLDEELNASKKDEAEKENLELQETFRRVFNNYDG